jgi:hypothetical protein
MRASFIAIGITMVVLSAGCSQSGSPTEPSRSGPSVGLTATTAAAVSHDVPFKGRLDGVYTLAFPAPLVLSVEGKGTGNATQLGQFTFEYHEVVNLSTGTGTGTYEFTAANGDTLIATWTGSGSPTSDPNVLSIIENATFTGGTGRFVNATGSFTVQRLFNFTTNSGAGSFEGTIRLR